MKNGKYVEYGIESWYKDDLLHREDGPAVVTLEVVHYYQNGVFHRENGPAIIYRNGSTIWYKHGVIHRDDGPARTIYEADGSSIMREFYYYEGKRIDASSIEEFKRIVKIRFLL